MEIITRPPTPAHPHIHIHTPVVRGVYFPTLLILDLAVTLLVLFFFFNGSLFEYNCFTILC